MEQTNEQVVENNETVENVEVSEQETAPVEKEEVTEEIKTFTQQELDEIVSKRLARAQTSFTKELEAAINTKDTEYAEKLKSIETDTQTMAEQLKVKESELTRLSYGIKKDKYDEVLALKEFRMSKEPNLSEEDVLKSILDERSDYLESTIKNIGIEIKNDVKETPLYSEEMLRMYPYLRNIK